MAAKKENFTDERLRKIKHDGSKKRLIYFDNDQKGLALQITPAGTKTFQFRKWDEKRGETKILTIGKYPSVSIKKARNEAKILIADMIGGIDVVAEAKSVKHEDTFDNVFKRWLEQYAKGHKRSWKEDERRYALYMKKPLGNKRLSWFNTSRLNKWHNNIPTLPKQRGKGTITPSTANRALALLNTIFNTMLPKSENPCKGVRKFPEESRDRFLQPEELQRFFQALTLEDTPVILRDYVLMSLYTGGRRANVLSMQWKEISFHRLVWTIPAAKSKNAAPMDIPLVEEGIEILERRKQQTKSVFVFPGTGKTGHYSEPKRAWKTLLKNAKLEDVRLHDLRRTMGSWQTMTGASSTIVGKTLGHKSPEATAVYARLNLDPVRDSMEKAVAAMQATKDLPDKIIPIKLNNER